MKTIQQLTDKIGIVGDLHFGQTFYNNGILTTYHNEKRAQFFDSMIQNFKENGVSTVLFAGDIFHSRALIGLADIHAVIDLFARKMADFNIITIVGNHDMLYENDDSINSLEMLNFIPNVTVVDEPTKFVFSNNNDWYLFPWLGTDANIQSALSLMKSVGATKEQADRNVFFGHFDIIGIDMGANNLSKHGFDQNEIASYCRYVISGHYHCKSIKKIGTSKIMYVGSPYQLSFAHVGNPPGYYICDSNLKIKFIENTINERYIDVHDYEDMSALPDDLSNCAVRYFTDNSRTMEDATNRQLALVSKNPLYLKPSPYGNLRIDDNDDNLVTLPEDTSEAEQITKMTQIEVAKHFMDNSIQPLPELHDGSDVKKAIITIIQEYDAS